MGIFGLKFSMNVLMNLSYHLGVAGILAVGGDAIAAGEAEIGTVVAFVSGLAHMNDPWGDLVGWFRTERDAHEVRPDRPGNVGSGRRTGVIGIKGRGCVGHRQMSDEPQHGRAACRHVDRREAGRGRLRGYGRTGSHARIVGSRLWLRPVAPDDEVIALSFDEMRNAALGDGEGNVHASHDGEGGSDHHRPRRSTAIHAK